MGQSDSQPQQGQMELQIRPYQSVVSEYEIVNQIQNDPAYGECRILRHLQGGFFVALKQFIVNNKSDQERVQQMALKLHQLQSEFIVRILELGKEEQQDMCSTYIKNGMIFEYYKDTMQKKIFHRKQIQLLFREVDIYYFMYNILSALKHLDNMGFKHGDIRPKTILLGDDGNYKLSEINFMVGYNSYRQFLLGEKGTCYLAPEYLNSLSKKELHPEHDVLLGDIFSLGLICLEMSTFVNVNDCYDFKLFKLNQQGIEEMLDLVQSTYSSHLTTILKGMLQIDPTQRWNITHILENLQPYEEHIHNIQCSPLKSRYLLDATNIQKSHFQQPDDLQDQHQNNTQSSQIHITSQNISQNLPNKMENAQPSQHQQHSNAQKYQSANKSASENFDIPSEDEQINQHSHSKQQSENVKQSSRHQSKQSPQQLQSKRLSNSDNILQTENNNTPMNALEPSFHSVGQEEGQLNKLKESPEKNVMVPLQEVRKQQKPKSDSVSDGMASVPYENWDVVQEVKNSVHKASVQHLLKNSPLNSKSPLNASLSKANFNKKNLNDELLQQSLTELDSLAQQVIDNSSNIRLHYKRLSIAQNNLSPNQNNQNQNLVTAPSGNKSIQQDSAFYDNDEYEIQNKMDSIKRWKKNKSQMHSNGKQQSFNQSPQGFNYSSPSKYNEDQQEPDSPLLYLDSNQLYQMYLQEYSKLKSERQLK